MHTKTNLGGRPPLPPEELRSEIIKIRLTKDEKATLQAAAAVYKKPLSEYLRDWIMSEATEVANHRKKAAITRMCATAEDKARTLGEDVEIKPHFKTYDVVTEHVEP